MLPQLVLAGCTEAPGSLARPNKIALGDDGTVWVSDFQHDQIVTFDADGRFLGRIGERGLGAGQLWRVTAMVADDGGLVVANLRPESDASDAALVTELKRFDGGGEVWSTLLDGRVTQEGARIEGIGRLPNGHLVLADSTHGELVEVDGTGRQIGRFGGIPRPDAAPHHVVVAGADVWMVEQLRHRITVLSPKGVERAFEPTDEPLRFPSAAALCTNAEDPWIAVADYGNHRIRRFTLDGTPLSSFAPHPAGPDQPVQVLDLAVSADCRRLYVVDSKGNRVVVTDPLGEVLATLGTW